MNKDFGAIFSCLLPGTDCKLEPEEGKTIEDGLEVRIAFAGAWKESLSELAVGEVAAPRLCWHCCCTSQHRCTSSTKWMRHSTCHIRRTWA